MNCPYCAETIPDEIVFCPKCGTQMGSPLPDSPAYRKPLPPGYQPPISGKAIGSLICSIFFFFFPLPASSDTQRRSGSVLQACQASRH